MFENLNPLFMTPWILFSPAASSSAFHNFACPCPSPTAWPCQRLNQNGARKLAPQSLMEPARGYLIGRPYWCAPWMQPSQPRWLKLRDQHRNNRHISVKRNCKKHSNSIKSCWMKDDFQMEGKVAKNAVIRLTTIDCEKLIYHFFHSTIEILFSLFCAKIKFLHDR